MRQLNTFKWCAVFSACWVLVVPVDMLAGAEHSLSLAQKTTIRDVALQPGGRLEGRVVDVDGHPAATRVLVLDVQGGPVAATQSTADGSFVVTNLPAGTYQVATSAGAVACRCWAERTAPPAAQHNLLLVEDGTVQRGQRPLAELLFSPPVLLTAIIVAAIAVPIAVHNAKKDAS